MNSKQVGSAIGAGFAVFCVIAAGAATILTSTTSIDANSLNTVNYSTTTSSTQTSIASVGSTATTSSFSTFDFANGTKLPDKATLSIGNATFRPGTGTAYVPITLDRATPNTVIARVVTVNGSGTLRALSGYHYQTVDTVVIFRPGDPLTQTVAVPIIGAAEGQFFQLKLREAPWGGLQGQSVGTVTASSTATVTAKATGTFRAARTFAPTGTLQFELLKDTHKRSPDGGWDRWATSLSHGRTQVANGETGLYLDSSIWPGIEGPVYWSSKGLVLHTQKLATPIYYEGQSWKYGASVLDGRNFLASQIGYGQYEWDARMPNRRGTWPAFWLVSTSGWPPEIDIYEGFGYQSYWDFDRHVGQTIHGGSGGVRSFQRGVVIQTEQAYGIKGYSEDFHRFAVDIQRDYITWFVDGKETYQSVNPFQGFRWYPIMDVAVKTDSAFTDGSGDMIIRSFKIYSAP
ncbi:family 16 glycosylhydrolase [Sphingobium sp. V4]|uniref:glycoside hydrolase family 16 protein n=1 Tax=Sphingobium sp. V4 TaxID=3038927 RepID=UPI002557C833|nr:family 16 glycosylhydrolase [Sphingobium sp. V4]WIW87587.1 family 16 glycosylhydrolase [Sphingobium sp. V4]